MVLELPGTMADVVPLPVSKEPVLPLLLAASPEDEELVRLDGPELELPGSVSDPVSDPVLPGWPVDEFGLVVSESMPPELSPTLCAASPPSQPPRATPAAINQTPAVLLIKGYDVRQPRNFRV